MVEHTKVIGIARRGTLINLAKVAPAALIKEGIIRLGSARSFGEQKTAHVVEQVAMRLIACIEEMYIALADADRSKGDPWNLREILISEQPGIIAVAWSGSSYVMEVNEYFIVDPLIVVHI